ncbi:hypothetical protein DCAR_0310109 [Daucus carota subsp. sativus]|uniref:KIB1-4 beta-propeller domain-containing protein n=2 Tax=Daucus carota subsp. sativus TaxID=79200 RepID=A0AAF0WMA9_DAUCS|nr:hypothetical protein DCAR_0310109 [Daucus carota subsp. sativus]
MVEINVEDEDEDWDEDEEHYCYHERYDYRKNSVSETRGLQRLATGKTYDVELPEASGRLILGTNKGWLLTLGRDLQISLLHPLLRQDIPLPHMGTFLHQPHSEEFILYVSPEQAPEVFIQRVAMSCKLHPSKNNGMYSSNPIVMAIYGARRYLAYARLTDKVWTEVFFPIMAPFIEDIAYYKGKFYALNGRGDLFVCDINDDSETQGRAKGTKIYSWPTDLDIGMNYNNSRTYLVESGFGFWLVVREFKAKYFKAPHGARVKYRTCNFTLWKMELKYSDHHSELPSCTCIPENNLGDQALFIGRATCLSLPSSEYIRPNCIYFTDDNLDVFYHVGGGHDMGIFNMETHTIEPFFHGKSIHPISPPLWYI